MTVKKKKATARVSHVKFAILLEELMSGPCTAKHLSDLTGVGHRSMCMFIRTLKDHKVIHVAAWDRDSIGRFGIPAYGLGVAKDVPKPTKPRKVINRDYIVRRNRAPLKGTPFYGLGG